MAKVTTTFVSDDKEMAKSIDKYNRKIDELIAENRKLAEQTRSQHNDTKEGFTGMIGKAAEMAKGVVSIGAAWGLAAEGLRKFDAEMTAIADKARELGKKSVSELISSGDLARSPQVQWALQHMPGKVTREQALESFAGVSAGAPMLDERTRLQLSAEVGRQAVTGVDLRKLGEHTGVMKARLGDDISANDVVDLAMKTQAMAGRDAPRLMGDEFLRSMALAKQHKIAGREDILGMGLEALTQGHSPETIQAAVGAAVANIDRSQVRGRDMVAYADASPAERFKLLTENADLRQKVMGGENALKFGALDFGRAADYGQQLRDAQEQDYARQQILDLGLTPEGRRNIRAQAAAWKTDTLQARSEQVALTQQDAKAYLYAQNSDQTMEGFVTRRRIDAADLSQRFITGHNAGALLEEGQRVGALDQQQVDDFRTGGDVAETLREIAGTLRTMKDDQQGLRRDVRIPRPDTHGETK